MTKPGRLPSVARLTAAVNPEFLAKLAETYRLQAAPVNCTSLVQRYCTFVDGVPPEHRFGYDSVDGQNPGPKC